MAIEISERKRSNTTFVIILTDDQGYADVGCYGIKRFTTTNLDTMANRAIAYHWELQVEYAYMILENYRFTRVDISNYMPFIEQSFIFFYKHYCMRQDQKI